MVVCSLLVLAGELLVAVQADRIAPVAAREISQQTEASMSGPGVIPERANG